MHKYFKRLNPEERFTCP